MQAWPKEAPQHTVLEEAGEYCGLAAAGGSDDEADPPNGGERGQPRLYEMVGAINLDVKGGCQWP